MTYTDYNDLNKACLKDSFSLPLIDQLVDATIGHEILNFMDAYLGYNQNPMYDLNQEHTSFNFELKSLFWLTSKKLTFWMTFPLGSEM